MAEKLIAEIYYSYGKGDGEELSERFVIEDTPEVRRDLLDKVYFDDSYESEDDFANGKTNVFSFDSYGGDWDDPTGGYIAISTKKDLIEEIQCKAEQDIAKIEELFAKVDANMSKDTVEIGGIKYELHDRKAEVGDKITITYKQSISEDMFEIGDIFVADVVYSQGTVIAEHIDNIKVISRVEYKVLHPASSENEPDDSDTEIIDILASISHSLYVLTGRITTVEADIKDIRENLTEELYESHSNINELSTEINNLHGFVQNVQDYTLDLTETIEMHTDDIVMLDDRTQDLLVNDSVKGEDDLISVEELKSAFEWINRSSRK